MRMVQLEKSANRGYAGSTLVGFQILLGKVLRNLTSHLTLL